METKHRSKWAEGFCRAANAEIARQGITRSRLADEAGLSYATVSPMLAGTTHGTLSSWEKIFHVLDMRLSVLVRKEDS